MRGLGTEEFRGEKIPVLEELLELAKQHDLVLNLELENGHVRYPGMEERTAEIVRRFRMCEQVMTRLLTIIPSS